MIKVNDVLNFLNRKFPLDTACDFDNAGLLIGNADCIIKKVLVCLDADINAVNKAKEMGANLIVTHHPVIFGGVKRITEPSVISELCSERISVISMHTNFDMGAGGVNDILCSLLPLKNVEKFKANDGFLLNCAESEIENADNLADELKKRLGCSVRYVCGRPIKKLLVCSGSGGDFINDAVQNGFDALITADVKHNQFIEALNYGVSLFDAGHFATENICVVPLSKMLSDRFNSVEFYPFLPENIKSN